MYQSFRSLLVAPALLGLATFSACQKAPVEPEKPQASGIVGRWALVQTSGGIAGGTRPADPRHLEGIEFTADGQALILLNGTPTATGTYTLSQAVAYNTRRPETFVDFTGLQLGGRSFIEELSATTLLLSDDCADGFGTLYRREQPLLCGTR